MGEEVPQVQFKMQQAQQSKGWAHITKEADILQPLPLNFRSAFLNQIDDMPASRFPHMRECQVCKADYTQQIEFECRLPLRVIEALILLIEVFRPHIDLVQLMVIII